MFHLETYLLSQILFVQSFNKKVEFKIPTSRYQDNFIYCVVLQSGTTK